MVLHLKSPRTLSQATSSFTSPETRWRLWVYTVPNLRDVHFPQLGEQRSVTTPQRSTQAVPPAGTAVLHTCIRCTCSLCTSCDAPSCSSSPPGCALLLLLLSGRDNAELKNSQDSFSKQRTRAVQMPVGHMTYRFGFFLFLPWMEGGKGTGN